MSMYSKWLKSWRDLPFLYNQWCNVLRWEKETRPFLRSREFLWQEGHTIHETEKEARELTLRILDIYAEVIENNLAMPVIKGKKTEIEKFSGAQETYTVESLMYDGRALQSGTSHYFGQNFTKPFDVKFQNRNSEDEYAYQTSWGISTRLIGGIIMSHGDNRGLKLPPKIAPIQIIVVPISMKNDKVIAKCQEIYDKLSNQFRVKIDLRDQYSAGYKFNDWEMRGVPIRIELGLRDIENNQLTIVRRDTFEKFNLKMDELLKIGDILNKIQDNMYNTCLEHNMKKTSTVTTLNEFEEKINKNQGYIKAMWCGNSECENKIREITGAKSRCIPFNQERISDICVCCGKKAKEMVIWGRQY